MIVGRPLRQPRQTSRTVRRQPRPPRRMPHPAGQHSLMLEHHLHRGSPRPHPTTTVDRRRIHRQALDRNPQTRQLLWAIQLHRSSNPARRDDYANSTQTVGRHPSVMVSAPFCPSAPPNRSALDQGVADADVIGDPSPDIGEIPVVVDHHHRALFGGKGRGVTWQQ